MVRDRRRYVLWEMEGCTAAAGDRDRAKRKGTREKKRAQAEKMARVKKKFCDESENGVDI